MKSEVPATPYKTNEWTFFSNYGHVLACLSQSPQPTTRNIALQVGITERAVQRLLARMAEAGVVTVEKQGRRNRYQLNLEKRLRHPLESHRTVGDMLELLSGSRKPVPDPLGN